MALSTQADVEKFLQIKFGSMPEDVADYLIEGADGLIIDYLGFDPQAEADLIEIHDPSHTFDLWVRRPPIGAVNAVTIDGIALPSSSFVVYLEDEDRSGLIRRIDGARWHSRLRGISVDYDAGYPVIPTPLRDGSVRIVARAFEKGVGFAADGHTPGVLSVSLAGSDSITWSEGANDVAKGALELMQEDRMGISRYKRSWI